MQLLSGSAYGLRQSTLVASVTIEIDPRYDFSSLDATMDALLARPGIPPTPLPDAAEAAEALLLRLIRWYHGVHRGQRTPLFEESWHRRFRSASGRAGAVFRIALPYLGRRTAGELVTGLIAIVDGLLGGGESAAKIQAEAAGRIQPLRERLLSLSPEGINAFHLMAAAHRLRMPCTNVIEEIFAFGMGANRRVLHSTVSDATPAIGTRMARRKSATAFILRNTGLPGAVHRRAADEQAAVRIARELGFPVVIKPDDQEQGRGVFAGLEDEASVVSAFRAAGEFSKAILVEKHVTGDDVRVTVLQGEVIKVMKRRAGGVTGDGTRTIAELAHAEEHSEASRLRAVDRSFVPVRLDAEANEILAAKGLAPTHVLPPGEFLALRRRGNVSAGGTQVLMEPYELHPDNLALAVRAARCLNLDLAGIDLIFTDPAQSWLEAGATILEINAMPQIGSTDTPAIYQEILTRMVPEGGRIPIHVVVTGQGGGLAAARAAQLMKRKACDSLSSQAGNWIGGRRATLGFDSGFDAARALFADAAVKSAVVVLSAADIMQFGLPFDRADSVEVIDMPQALEGRQLVAAAMLRIDPDAQP